MTLTQIMIFVVLALVTAVAVPGKWRGWLLFAFSVIAIFWLQPPVNIRWLDFSLPFATLALTAAMWVITLPAPKLQANTVGAHGNAPDHSPSSRFTRDDALTLVISIGIILFLALARYIPPIEALQITTRPPDMLQVIGALAGIGVVLAILLRGRTALRFYNAAIFGIILIFVLIRTEPLALEISRFLRAQAGLDVSLAAARELDWLGFSYVAFRLIHTLRDRQTGILPEMTLREYITYVIFFPAYTAGPIDRSERFLTDYRALPETAKPEIDVQRIGQGFRRIFMGLLKKFVIADSIALFVLNAANADQAVSTGAMWVMLYGYAFRLFFDFSGYTDIAIGIGILFGITLPENFNLPYLKNNINAFWQSWHMTLSAWVRAYVYSPMQRSLLRRQPKPPQNLIIFLCHLSTMLIIGLWHGITLPFVVWGLWHGLGLFFHKLWSDRTRKWYMSLKDKPRTKQAWTIAGILLTFHFVCLGWVFFALPDMAMALRVFGRLFGFAW